MASQLANNTTQPQCSRCGSYVQLQAYALNRRRYQCASCGFAGLKYDREE